MRKLIALVCLSGCAEPAALPGGGSATSPTTTPTAPTAPAAVTDVFVQTPDLANVLWVVDGTASGQALQTALTENGPAFLDFFVGSGISYHIGVVTMDMDDPTQSGNLREAGGISWVDQDTPDPLETFAALIGAGTAGSGVRQGREAAWTALAQLDQPGGANEGFQLAPACTTILTVAGAEDESGSDVISEADTIAWLLDLEATSGPVSYFVLSPDPLPAYDAVTAAVGGEHLDPTDMVAALRAAGPDAACLENSYVLSSPADASTIEVVVETDVATLPFVEATDWTYDAGTDTLAFVAYVPSVGATVQITYVPLP